MRKKGERLNVSFSKDESHPECLTMTVSAHLVWECSVLASVANDYSAIHGFVEQAKNRLCLMILNGEIYQAQQDIPKPENQE